MAAQAEPIDIPAPRPRRNWILIPAGLVVAAALAYFGWAWWDSRHVARTDDAFVGGDIIPVLSRVSGYVETVSVEENQEVKAGDILVTVDSREIEQKVAQVTADLEAARSSAGGAGLAGAQAQAARAKAAAARADIAQAEADAKRAQSDLDRMRPLVAEQIVSQQRFEAAEASARAAAARVTAAQENAAAAEAQFSAADAAIGSAQSKVVSAEATLEQTKLQLSYTRIAAPSDGVVARKSVEPGQLVSPGQALMAVVPLSQVWVTANLKETQLRGLNPGDPCTIEVDAYHGLKLHGTVESISPGTGAQFSLFPPENATGNFTKVVQRVPVRIELASDPNRPALRPGMSCRVAIRTR